MNDHLKEMCESSSIDFIDNGKNFNPKRHLNNSKLHLNDRGSYKLGNVFIDYIANVHK